jgi:hypothetical protein
MLLVYSQATVTIVASRASEANGGFCGTGHCLSMRRQNMFLKYLVNLKRMQSQEGSFVLLPQVTEPAEPPSQRAWALQERLMSSGILEYGSSRLLTPIFNFLQKAQGLLLETLASEPLVAQN